MQVYKEFRPTAFDGPGLNADRFNIGSFLVAPVMQTRDSEVLERSNFRSFLRAMGGESDTVQVHRFGHWGPGWFEIILIDPRDEKAVATAQEIEDGLADYPIVDESDYSDLEFEETCDYWAHMSVRERVDYITRANDRASAEWQIPVFAARRDELPEDPAGRLWEELTRV